MHGDQDDAVPLASSEKFHEALAKQGVEAQLHVIEGGGHHAYGWGEEHLQTVKDFFERHLRDRAGDA